LLSVGYYFGNQFGGDEPSEGFLTLRIRQQYPVERETRKNRKVVQFMWKSLPVNQERLKEIVFFGNGKDCWARIASTEKVCQFEVSDPAVEIIISGQIKTEVFNDGSDMDLGIRYLPLEKLRIALCEIDFPGSEDEWQESLERAQQHSDFLHWAISGIRIHLKLETQDEQANRRISE
jgi:hypothetical protein